jgi:hypothetical protein
MAMRTLACRAFCHGLLAFTLGILPALLQPAFGGAITPEAMSLAEIVRDMEQADQTNSDSLIGYTCQRRYSLENHRLHKKAEINVRMTYTFPGHKKFEILSEQGASVICQRVLRPMLAAEEESSGDDIRPFTKMTLSNYSFNLIGSQVWQERPAYLLDLVPRTRNKFLIRGRVWVDSQNFGIIHVEAVPGQNPSVFIHNAHIVQQSARFDEIWLPLFNHSVADSFLFGRTDVSIDSWDYELDRAAK